MTAPKPISVVYTNPEDYEGPEPQPFTIVGREPSGGGIESVVAGENVSIDNTDPKNPVINASGGGGGDVASVNGKTGEVVLSVGDVLEDGNNIVSGQFTAITLVDDLESPAGFTSIGSLSGVSASGVNGGVVVDQMGVKISSLTDAATITAPASGGATIEVALPSASGTLVLTDDIDDVVRGVNGVAGIWRGTLAEYTALPVKDPNVLYVTKD